MTISGQGKGFDWLRLLAILPLPCLVILIIFFAYTDPGNVIEPPYLLTVLNLVFLTLIPFSIAYLAGRSFSSSGQISILLIGCGMTAFGFGSLIAGLLIGFPGGTNLTAAVHNTGSLLASIFLCASGFLALQKAPQLKLEKYHGFYLAFIYPAVIIFIAIFAFAAYGKMIPPFFIQGEGPTVLRQGILGAATVLFAISAVVFIRVSTRTASRFTRWFGLALMLITIGMCAIFLQKSVGSRRLVLGPGSPRLDRQGSPVPWMPVFAGRYGGNLPGFQY